MRTSTKGIFCCSILRRNIEKALLVDIVEYQVAFLQLLLGFVYFILYIISSILPE